MTPRRTGSGGSGGPGGPGGSGGPGGPGDEPDGGLGSVDRTRAPLSGAALDALDRVRRMADIEPRAGAGSWRSSKRWHDGRSDAADRGAGGVAYTGSGHDPRDPRPLAGLFTKLAHKRGWETSLDVAQVTSRWSDLVGRDVAANCTVERFDPPTLVVRTSSTTWATQLKILKDGLLDKIEREIGRRVVEDIEIHGPAQRSFTRGRKSVRGRGPRDTWG